MPFHKALLGLVAALLLANTAAVLIGMSTHCMRSETVYHVQYTSNSAKKPGIWHGSYYRHISTGDEEFTRIPGGEFVVFTDEGVDFVNASTKSVSTTITRDQDGRPLTNAQGRPRTWNDALYVEDPDTNKRYIFVNEGDIYEPGNNSYSYVSVIDVERKQVGWMELGSLCTQQHMYAPCISPPQFVRRIKVRPNPVHSYSIPPLGEVWVHSDANATFDVIDVSNLSLAAQPVPVCGLIVHAYYTTNITTCPTTTTTHRPSVVWQPMASSCGTPPSSPWPMQAMLASNLCTKSTWSTDHWSTHMMYRMCCQRMARAWARILFNTLQSTDSMFREFAWCMMCMGFMSVLNT